MEEQAALAYDLAAIKFRGIEATTNFDTDTFAGELEMVDMVRGAVPAPAVLSSGHFWDS